ncbi:MAG: extracellular solute-binding protein [Anaerolineae bacterium]|nr:extracellular solute-binding protein [Anaerolineae bacterium]
MRSRAILSILLLLAISGCTEPTPTAEPPTPTWTPTAVPPTTAPTPTPEPQPIITTLKLWLPEELNPYGNGPGADILRQQLAEFNKSHPDLQVDVVVKKIHGRGGILDYLRTAGEAVPSILPDLIVVGAGDLETLTTANHIQPLDDLLPSPTAGDRFPFAVEMGMVAEQAGDKPSTMGFVIGADMQHLVYRTDLLSSPPISWTQVITPPIPFVFPAGGINQQVNDATLIQYLAAGGKLTDQEGNPALDERALIRLLTFYSNCTNTDAISPTVVLSISDADQSWERFKAGEGAIAVVEANSYWPEASIDRMGEPFATAIAAASVPTRNGYPFTIVRDVWAIAMVAQDPNRQALTMTLFNWLTAPDNNADWTLAAGYLPSTHSALRMWDVSEAERVALRSMLEAAIPAPSQDVMAKVGPAMQTAVEGVLEKTVSPQEAARTAVQSLK